MAEKNLTPDDVKAICDDFRQAVKDGATKTAAISAIAERFGESHGITESGIRYHLKRANLIGEGAESITVETDADLGIGEDDETAPKAPGGAVDLSALMADPRFAE